MRARYLVLGDPVGHSLSPAMMTAAFAAAGLDAVYTARRIAAAEFPPAMARLHDTGVAGANVTVPHKEAALHGSVSATDTAHSIGAVNTLIRREDGWEGDNTDGPGFLDWVEGLGLAPLLERETLVLGAGGSARAVVWGLLRGGCPRVRVANRSLARAESLAASLRNGRRGEGARAAEADRIVCEAPGKIAPAGGLVVNCTSLGLRPHDPSPASPDSLMGAAAYLDLVYPDPPGVCAARDAGVRAENGLGLLVAQGARSFARWTGRPANAAAMREAAERELRRRAQG